MAPLTRRNSALACKIATLQLHLAPLVPLPSGPPHPCFPKTLMAFHLLTEEELDSIAHYYHQSTPGPFTNQYPAPMNWDKDFLSKHTPTKQKPGGKNTPDELRELARMSPKDEAERHSRRLSVQEKEFLTDLMKTVEDLRVGEGEKGERRRSLVQHEGGEGESRAGTGVGRNPYAGLSDKDRIRIKRRKVGKFIGLVGMETPVEEIAGRIQASLDRAIEQSREELRRNEEVMLRRKKMA